MIPVDISEILNLRVLSSLLFVEVVPVLVRTSLVSAFESDILHCDRQNINVLREVFIQPSKNTCLHATHTVEEGVVFYDVFRNLTQEVVRILWTDLVATLDPKFSQNFC